MGPTVASTRRLAPLALAALATALLAGCSSERLSQRTQYPAPTVTVTRTVAVMPQPAPQPVIVAAAHRGGTRVVKIEQVHRKTRPHKKAAVKPAAAKPAAPVVATTPPHGAPMHEQASATPPATIITASDVEHQTKGDAQARTTVISFHRLLNDHDGDACSLLTPNYLVTAYKTDAASAMAQCRAGVEQLTIPVSVVVEDSGIDSGVRWVQVLSTLDGHDRRQVMRLAKVGDAWLIDSVEVAQS